LEQLDRHVRKINEQKRIQARRKQVSLWLQVICTVCMLEKWHSRMKREKTRKLRELKQFSAALIIQRGWRRQISIYNSKAMMQIILRTRQVLWLLTFKVS